MEAVPHAEGESHRSQYREDDQEEGAHSVYQQRGGGEEQFQQVADTVPEQFLRLVGGPLRIHPYLGGGVGGSPAQLVYLAVKLFVAYKVGGLRITHLYLVFQTVLLLTVFLHVQRLSLQHPVRALHHEAEHAVHRAQHQRGEKQDADAQGEGPQQRIHVNRLGTGKRLPHAHRHIEQGPQARDALAHVHHILTEGKHLVVQGLQNGMEV